MKLKALKPSLVTIPVRCEASLTFKGGAAFCESCNKTVHDLTRSTEYRARALSLLYGGEVCGKVLADRKGAAFFESPTDDRGHKLPLALSWILATGCATAGTGQAPAANAGTLPTSFEAEVGSIGRMVSGLAENPDIDQDRILSVDDACPMDPETYNGNNDEDGCPDTARVVVATAGVLYIPPSLLFSQNSAELSAEDRLVLDALADILTDGRDYGVVEVRGYADASERRAERLSQLRAEAAVAELVRHGVPAASLRVVAQGSRSPRAVSNRFVQFFLRDPSQ